jgi:hypothetical protein
LVRIFKPDEIPKGFREAIEQDDIDLRQVKYVVHSDDDKEAWKIAAKLGYYILVPTVTDDWLHVVIY